MVIGFEMNLIIGFMRFYCYSETNLEVVSDRCSAPQTDH